MSPARWLTILGIGEDGVEGLSPAAHALLHGASFVVGGARHLALAAPVIRGTAMPWCSPIEASFPAILARRGQAVVVLASGDPFWFGIGVTLARHVPMAEMRCLPAPSAFALACARLGWALHETATLSFCGRPLAAVLPLLHPGVRLLALSADAATPGMLAALLREHGFGASRLHILEALGGPAERIRDVRADDEVPRDIAALNLVAVEVVAPPAARVVALAAGRDDALFEHDGQLTRREVRALTLSALAPRIGELLWDVGSGAGSVAIEWLLCHPANRAIGVERDPARLARAARNAQALGTPALRLVAGAAPAALVGLPAPDAVFIGGGAHDPAMIPAIWAALRPGGRLVANAVTLETEAVLIAACLRHGGSLTRLSLARMDMVGTMHAFRPAMTVTQWAVSKS